MIDDAQLNLTKHQLKFFCMLQMPEEIAVDLAIMPSPEKSLL